jgi:integrase
MSLYKRGGIFWYKFKFNGALVRESSGLASKDAARDVQDTRRLELRRHSAGISERKRPVLFVVAADTWLKLKRDDWAPKTAIIEKTNLSHLKNSFNNRLLTDIAHQDVAEYKHKRTVQGAAPKTISLELGTLRAVMLYNDLDAQWSSIRKKIDFGKARKIGHVLTIEEETALLQECLASRSRSLHVAVTLALQTCMRYSELRLLRWRQIDFGRRIITVGASKTEAGTGREIPMTGTAFQCLSFWAANFPNRKPVHFIFPAEKYGAAGDDFKPKVYDTNPSQPIGTWKEAWEAAKTRAGVECRFHDLRHTGCTHLLEAGVSINEVTEIMGWSTSTAIRMVRDVYGHVGPVARRNAMDKLDAFLAIRAEGAQKWAHSTVLKQENIQ